ncbi:MAG: feruloyl-CoA synthase [Burkholderiaceae bacterium]|nr:MAG: feruloyl-CoA synthase [Burkholderiaceae bacterium]
MPDRLFAEPHIRMTERDDGAIFILSAEPLQDAPLLIEDFRRHAALHPDRVLVGDHVTGVWRTCTWGEMRKRVDRLAQGLIDQGFVDRPIMILSGASIEHLTLELAALTLGVPVAPASVPYSLGSESHEKLRGLAEVVDPCLVFAQAASFESAARAVSNRDRVVVSPDGVISGSRKFEDLFVEATSAVEERFSRVDSASVAKILFTSGSTGKPKGVINTQGMLAVNQQQIRQVWPFLRNEPPVLLDWLPWSHTFGGNHNVDMVLANGGSYWIDDGGPSPSLVKRTIANLNDVQPTVFFNVPAGYSVLVPILEKSPDLAARFFSKLRVAFFAASALPQTLWDRIELLAAKHHSEMMLTTSWGLTETAPSATTTHFKISQSNNIGVPLPGVELKLTPDSGGKLEIRIRGPNVTPGYYGRPDLTREKFDSEGYLRTGDAVQLVDPRDPARGIRFDGRIAEDFKLATGTFVSAGTLRPKLLSLANGLFADAVICGHDTDAVKAMAWLSAGHAGRCSEDGTPEPSLRQEIEHILDQTSQGGAGSSQRVERLLLVTKPPDLESGEITDKGYINQAKVQEIRHEIVILLNAEQPDPRVVVVPKRR